MGTIVDLRALFQSVIDYRGRKFEALKDRNIRDTESVATTDVSKAFFLQIGTKTKSMANFQGDKSLVKEANVFLPLQVRAYTRKVLTVAEFLAFWHKGYVELKKLVPDTITVDEDNLGNWSTGPVMSNFYDASAPSRIADAMPGDQRPEGKRTYIVPENKLYPGGRAIECQIQWQESGGNGLTGAADAVVEFYGVEFEPAR
jgi:hypothetical protein